MADKCNQTERYPNGLMISIEEARRGGDFQIEEYVCRECILICALRVEDAAMEV